MQIFDRLRLVTIDEKSLPNHIDLGRFFVVDSKEDITNRVINVGSDKFIDQELLDSKNRNLQDLLCYFLASTQSIERDNFSIVPLMQSVKEKLFLNDFETLLESKLFHLEEIFRQPHNLLQRTIEKVNVSRAKRIPAKSYQNLSSHTEDWLHKSIVSFKPRRILNEELDLEFDVYENQVTVALIDRCIIYLNSRIQEVHDIGDFLKEYAMLLSDRDDQSGWYKKVMRNLELIGCVYEDDNYSGNESRDDILSKTHQRLIQMSKRLKALQSAFLFEEVNHRVVISLMSERDVKPTNVIANHRHYRHVRDLWLALNKVDLEKNESERAGYEQEVIQGLRSYCKAIITYLVNDNLNYELSGTYSSWLAIHDKYSSIRFEETKENILRLHIGKTVLSFLTFGNQPIIKDKDLPHDTYILALNANEHNDKVISISPYDADSVERVGKIIRSYLLKEYVTHLRKQYEYPQILLDYLDCIVTEDLIFYKDGSYLYSYAGIPQKDLSKADAVARLSCNELYKRRSRPDRDKIRQEMEKLIDDINTNANVLSSSLYCFDCMLPLERRNLTKLNYLAHSCGFVMDTSSNHVVFHNVDEKYEHLSKDDWGMDYLEYNE